MSVVHVSEPKKKMGPEEAKTLVSQHDFGYRWLSIDPNRSEYPMVPAIWITEFGPRMRMVFDGSDWFLDVPKEDRHEYRHFGFYPSLQKCLEAAEIHYLMETVPRFSM